MMFDNSSAFSDRNTNDLSLNHVRDGLVSLTHRVGQIEALLSRKMDRSQCLNICQKKASFGQMRKYIDQFQSRVRDEQNQELERNKKMQEIAIDKINELGKKLKTNQSTKHKQEGKGAVKEYQKRAIQPQQLYIQSNETIFSLLIEEISKLQTKDDDLQRQLDLRNKKIVNLNNQVYNKLQKIEAEIEQKLKFNSSLQDSKVGGNTWSHIEKSSKPTVHKCTSDTNNQFQSLRIDMFNKNMENLQQELLNKMNIKDILPLIKQNYQPLADSLEEVREYVEQSIESTKRILSSQTEINKQISLGVKLAWWHSFDQEHQFAIINKQMLNLVPEIIEVGAGNKPNFIQIHHQGLYMIKIYPIDNSSSAFMENHEGEDFEDAFEIMIGTNTHIVGRQSVLRLQKNSQIRIIQRVSRQIVIFLQKL